MLNALSGGAGLATTHGFEITHIETCDFSRLNRLSNADTFKQLGVDPGSRVARFIERSMGVNQRFQCEPEQDALDLARSAIARLVDTNPAVTQEAEFFIYVGISNPMPAVTASAYLAGEFGFKNVSCWDLKSGCSAGVLALIQAYQWINMGAKSGVIVCSETMSRFANPAVLQMSAAIGDGAVALQVSASNQWQLKASVHGTDPELSSSMMVKGRFPVDIDHYDPADYRFAFQQKSEVLKTIGNYWISSLQQLIATSGIEPSSIKHYIAHQVDASKNAAIADHCGISAEHTARCFADYGNMACPTVFVNYYHWIARDRHEFNVGDYLVFHAVGGGVSWAAMSLEYVG